MPFLSRLAWATQPPRHTVWTSHLRCLGLGALVVVAGCSDPPANTHAGTLAGVVWVSAPVVGATVRAFVLDKSGETGALLGTSAPTGPDGGFLIDVGFSGGRMLLRAQGGRYQEPASGKTVALSGDGGADVLDLALVDFVPFSAVADLALTVASTLAREHAVQRLGRFDIDEALNGSMRVLGEHFAAPDLAHTAPADFTKPVGNLDDDAAQLGLRLQGLSRLTRDMAESSHPPVDHTALSSLLLANLGIRDLAQIMGRFDGQGRDGPLSTGTGCARCALGVETFRAELAVAIEEFLDDRTHNLSGLGRANAATTLQRLRASDNAELFPIGTGDGGSDVPEVASDGPAEDGATPDAGASEAPDDAAAEGPAACSAATCTDLAAAPWCNPASGACEPCRLDADCPAAGLGGSLGLCLAGGCPKETDAIFVKNDGSTCNAAGTGSRAIPKCDLAEAYALIGGGDARRTIVAHGPDAFGPFRHDLADRVAIVGQGGPILDASAAPAGSTAVDVAAGSLWMRGFEVSGGKGAASAGFALADGAGLVLLRSVVGPGQGVGIRAAAGARLRLAQVQIRGQGRGGVDAPVDAEITNSVFNGNGTPGGSGSDFGAVRLAGAGLFLFNSVVDNTARSGAGGVLCLAAAQEILASIVFGNLPADVSGSCPVRSSNLSMTPASGLVSDAVSGDPAFADRAGGDFHLTGASPCRDAVSGLAAWPAVDFFGKPRPVGAKDDCGADEYTP